MVTHRTICSQSGLRAKVAAFAVSLVAVVCVLALSASDASAQGLRKRMRTQKKIEKKLDLLLHPHPPAEVLTGGFARAEGRYANGDCQHYGKGGPFRAQSGLRASCSMFNHRFTCCLPTDRRYHPWRRTSGSKNSAGSTSGSLVSVPPSRLRAALDARRLRPAISTDARR